MKPAKIFLLLLVCLTAVTARAAAQAAAQAPDVVSTVVTVIDHRPDARLPEISKADVIVRQDGNVRPVLAWERLRGAEDGVDLAVLIDDSLDQRISLHWTDIANFFRTLPPGSRIAIAYGSHGSAIIAQPFTSDPERAVKALRLPVGQIEESSSIYQALTDLFKQWPPDHNRRAVLLISDGIDVFYGILESTPALNINLKGAVDAAQKSGVTVYSIFASGASSYSRNLYLVNNGQASLALLALESGGRNYQSGSLTPVDFSPFLKEIQASLSRQYRLTFRAKLGPKPGFARLQLSAEQRGVEFRGPSRVYLPAAR